MKSVPKLFLEVVLKSMLGNFLWIGWVSSCRLLCSGLNKPRGLSRSSDVSPLDHSLSLQPSFNKFRITTRSSYSLFFFFFFWCYCYFGMGRQTLQRASKWRKRWTRVELLYLDAPAMHPAYLWAYTAQVWCLDFAEVRFLTLLLQKIFEISCCCFGFFLWLYCKMMYTNVFLNVWILYRSSNYAILRSNYANPVLLLHANSSNENTEIRLLKT